MTQSEQSNNQTTYTVETVDEYRTAANPEKMLAATIFGLEDNGGWKIVRRPLVLSAHKNATLAIKAAKKQRKAGREVFVSVL